MEVGRGGEVRRGPGRAIIPHRPERSREELLYPVLRPRRPPQECRMDDDGLKGSFF